MDVQITDASLPKNRVYEAAVFYFPHRPSPLIRVIVTLAAAIMTFFAPAAGAGAGGAATGLPIVSSLADARIGSLLLRDGEQYVEAPRLATDIDITVSGPTSRARVTQIFNNPTAAWVEASCSAGVPATTRRIEEKMTAVPPTPKPSSRWRPSRLSLATAATFALAGLWLIADAFYIHAKAALAQVLLDRAFTAEIASGTVIKPWSWADTWPVARIEVRRLGAHAIVLAGGSGQALAFGPGHLERTPDAGEPGTAVYAAHRDTHFAFLSQIEGGDEIVVTRRDATIARFRVTHTQVVRWDASGIDPAAPGRHLALVTCWPLDSAMPGPLRYVVHADLAD